MKLEPLLYVSDIFRSLSFYRDILRFQIGELFPNRDRPTYAPIFIGENKLMLSQARNSNRALHQDQLGGSGAQLFVKVENVTAEYERLKSQVKIIQDLETKPWGDKEFTIADPDGYLISFYTPSE